jgi:hypothetical protein
MTIGALFTAIALLGLRSPAHERCPEARWRPSGGVDRDSA